MENSILGVSHSRALPSENFSLYKNTVYFDFWVLNFEFIWTFEFLALGRNPGPARSSHLQRARG